MARACFLAFCAVSSTSVARFLRAADSLRASALLEIRPDIALVAPQAEKRFKEASTTGLDQQAATALAVLVAAHPDKRADYDKTWKDIVAYTNDLAVAEARWERWARPAR